MFVDYVNLVLCWQTFISPTLITCLNHQKILQKYQVQSYKFCCKLIILFLITSLILQHVTSLTQELFIPSDFSLHFKATVIINKVLKGKLTCFQLLEGPKCESQTEYNGKARSQGTLLGSQHLKGVEGCAGAPRWDYEKWQAI
jgi:hypothetical protein